MGLVSGVESAERNEKELLLHLCSEAELLEAINAIDGSVGVDGDGYVATRVATSPGPASSSSGTPSASGATGLFNMAEICDTMDKKIRGGHAKTYPACALQGNAARWLSAHYKTIARSIARAMARGLGFVTPCPNKQGKNAYFSKVSDASGTACDAVNVREDCKHFGPPLWVVPVEERGPFGGPS